MNLVYTCTPRIVPRGKILDSSEGFQDRGDLNARMPSSRSVSFVRDARALTSI